MGCNGSKKRESISQSVKSRTLMSLIATLYTIQILRILFFNNTFYTGKDKDIYCQNCCNVTKMFQRDSNYILGKSHFELNVITQKK